MIEKGGKSNIESLAKVRNNENGRNIGDRVIIKKDKWEKYVRDVDVPDAEVAAWQHDREYSKSAGEETEKNFLDDVPHPKAEVVMSSQLFIVKKMPGQYWLSPLMHSKRGVWVDVDDVEDKPLYTNMK